jgi:predicted DNA-binding transcriptional regulator
MELTQEPYHSPQSKPHRLAATLANEELEGNTLNVYAYVVHEGKPVGTRDVTRGANLSSTSVAHRHLQKLEDLGLLERNQYGDYVLKEKTGVSGYVWVGRTLVPRLLFYSFFFMGAFAAEIIFVVFGLFVLSLFPDVSFIYLTVMTAIAMALFLHEGTSLNRRLKHGN